MKRMGKIIANDGDKRVSVCIVIETTKQYDSEHYGEAIEKIDETKSIYEDKIFEILLEKYNAKNIKII